MKVIINIGLKKGVLDDQGKATHHSLNSLNFKSVEDVRIKKQIILQLNCKTVEEAKSEATKMCKEILANEVIEDYEIIIEDK